MAVKKTSKARRFIGCSLLGLVVLCLVAAAISALSNRSLPTGPERLDSLTPLDKARLAEALQLKRSLGNQVWPGFGEMDIPVIVWNKDYSFLVGYADPPQDWQPVPGEAFQGQPYYRKQEADPQNFAVQVGDRWVASIATKYETDAFLIAGFQDFLPPVIEQIFPYRILIQPSEVQIAAVIHESFHVLQAQVSPDRLEAAEGAHRYGERYWPADEAVHAAWSAEINLLAEALSADSNEEAAEFTRQFLQQRQARRSQHSLDLQLIDYERQLEWEEGLAKYAEMEILRQAWRLASDYQPLAALDEDPEFNDYQIFPQRWSQEISQMKRQASQEGENRFYLTGMAQATLLDRLMPDWKGRALEADVYLEDLLREAITQ
jgi:hypothetical protein